MPKRKIAPNTEHGYVGEPKRKAAKPKEFNNPQWIIDYWLDRDRILYKLVDNESKEQILKRYKNETKRP